MERNSESSSLATFSRLLMATVVRIPFLTRATRSVRVARRIAYPMGVAIGWNASTQLRAVARRGYLFRYGSQRNVN